MKVKLCRSVFKESSGQDEPGEVIAEAEGISDSAGGSACSQVSFSFALQERRYSWCFRGTIIHFMPSSQIIREAMLLVQEGLFRKAKMTENIFREARLREASMPALGEIKYGGEIGYKSATSQFIWHACEGCGKQRWVRLDKGNPMHKVCIRCSNRLKGPKSSQPGAKHPNWQGGRVVLPEGYIYIKSPSHPRANSRGYVMEHILVWEQVHNKPLPKGWVIHHLNGVKGDNRPENLIALPSRRHQHILAAKGKRIRELEAKVKLLETALNSQQLIWWSEN